jgi:hypothetical protein
VCFFLSLLLVFLPTSLNETHALHLLKKIEFPVFVDHWSQWAGSLCPTGHMADHLEAGGSLEFFVSSKCLGSLCNRVVLKNKNMLLILILPSFLNIYRRLVYFWTKQRQIKKKSIFFVENHSNTDIYISPAYVIKPKKKSMVTMLYRFLFKSNIYYLNFRSSKS